MKKNTLSPQQRAKIEQQIRIERSLVFYKLLNLPTLIMKKISHKTNNTLPHSPHIASTVS